MPTKSIFNLFGRSPIRPLQEHMSTVHACVAKLQPFFAAIIKKIGKLPKKFKFRFLI